MPRWIDGDVHRVAMLPFLYGFAIVLRIYLKLAIAGRGAAMYNCNSLCPKKCRFRIILSQFFHFDENYRKILHIFMVKNKYY